MGVLFVLIVWVLCAWAGHAVSAEGKKGLGAIMGLLFGPIGVLVAAIAFSKK